MPQCQTLWLFAGLEYSYPHLQWRHTAARPFLCHQINELNSFFLGLIFRVCFTNLSQPKDTIFLGPLPLIKPWSPSVARRATTTSPSTWAPWCLPRPVAPSTKKQDRNGRDQSRSNIRINHLYQTTDCPVINVLYTIYIPFCKTTISN